MKKAHLLILSVYCSVLPYYASAATLDLFSSNKQNTPQSVSTGTTQPEITSINEAIINSVGKQPTGSGISLNSAPVGQEFSVFGPINNHTNTPQNTVNIQYTPWELLHRTPMLAGFMWIGNIVEFITPAMYIGTPFAGGQGYVGGNNPNAQNLTNDEALTYKQCLNREVFLSFGKGQRIENSDIRELKAIAKACALNFYGSYFDGKKYTTREEYLMALFTLFGEKTLTTGTFQNNEFVSNGDTVGSRFKDLKGNTWYAPYVARADELSLLSHSTQNWKIAEAISDTEAIDILRQYSAYRMGYSGTDLEKGMIVTDAFRFNMTFVSAKELLIRIQ